MVKVISFEEYSLLPQKRRTALSDYYARESRNADGQIYGLFSDGVMVSYLILCIEGVYGVISFIETEESCRGKGNATELVKAVMAEKDMIYSLHIISTNPEYKAILAIVRNSGFYAYSGSTVFTYKTDAEMWKRMDALPLGRMRTMLLAKGGKCVPFSELTKEELSKLSESCSNEFKNTLNPGELLDNSARALDWDLSFAMFEGDTLKAYSLITRPGKKHVVVEQIAAADNVRGAGFVVAPLSMTLERVRANTEIEKMTMTIAETNTASRNFLSSILKGVDVKEEKNICFYYKKR